MFNPHHIEYLKTEFSRIKTVNPDRLPQFHSMFDKMDDETLVQVSTAGIKFLSKLAQNECVRRGININ